MHYCYRVYIFVTKVHVIHNIGITLLFKFVPCLGAQYLFEGTIAIVAIIPYLSVHDIEQGSRSVTGVTGVRDGVSTWSLVIGRSFDHCSNDVMTNDHLNPVAIFFQPVCKLL